MKTLENELTGLPKPSQTEKKEFMSYGDLIDICISVAPKEGFSLTDQKSRFRILDITEKTKVGEELSFEDADFHIVSACVNEMKWNVLHRDIVKFGNVINNCK